MPFSSWTLDTSMLRLALEIEWGIMGGIKESSNLITTFGVPPISHNVAIKQNTAVGWIPQMAIILAKNNGAWHIALVDPIKPMGVLGLKIELGAIFGTPLEVDAP